MISKVGLSNSVKVKGLGFGGLGKNAHKFGFSALKKKVGHGLESVAKKLTNPHKSGAKNKISEGVQSQYRSEAKREFYGSSKVDFQRSGNLSRMRQEINVIGKETIKTSGQTQSLTIKSANKPAAFTQIVQADQKKDSLTQIGSQLNKVINAETGLKTYAEANKSIKEWDTIANTKQTFDKQISAQSSNEIQQTSTTLNKQGAVTGEQFLHRLTQVDSATDWNQQLSADETKNVRQETSSDKRIVGDATVITSSIFTLSDRDVNTEIATQSKTNTQTTSTDFDKEGNVVVQRFGYQEVEGNDVKNIVTQENSEHLKESKTVIQGQQSVLVEKGKGLYELIQTTLGKADQVISQLDPSGSVIAQRSIDIETESTLNRSIQSDSERVIARNSESVIGQGLYREASLTDINTDTRIAASTGAITNTHTDRDIVGMKTVAWEGAIAKSQDAQGSTTYAISNSETVKNTVGDVTVTGANKTVVETKQVSGKEISGVVAYDPAEAVAPAAAPKATIAINFGTYTGLASGFKMDSGEVSFELHFSSAELTKQESVRTQNGEVISESQSKTGQLNDATLVGTLRSVVASDGTRVIEVSAAYQKSGEKFAVEKADDAGVALSEAETNVEIQGSMVIAGTPDNKTIQSSFEVNRVDQAQAEGTSATAVRKALDVSDPLRKSFSFDRGIFSFQLGFASLNIAVYA